MPIYELKCQHCECVEEIKCSYKEYKSCIYKCHQCYRPMEKIISSGGFVLIGEGFYKPTKQNP